MWKMSSLNWLILWSRNTQMSETFLLRFLLNPRKSYVRVDKFYFQTTAKYNFSKMVTKHLYPVGFETSKLPFLSSHYSPKTRQGCVWKNSTLKRLTPKNKLFQINHKISDLKGVRDLVFDSLVPILSQKCIRKWLEKFILRTQEVKNISH